MPHFGFQMNYFDVFTIGYFLTKDILNLSLLTFVLYADRNTEIEDSQGGYY